MSPRRWRRGLACWNYATPRAATTQNASSGVFLRLIAEATSQRSFPGCAAQCVDDLLDLRVVGPQGSQQPAGVGRRFHAEDFQIAQERIVAFGREGVLQRPLHLGTELQRLPPGCLRWILRSIVARIDAVAGPGLVAERLDLLLRGLAIVMRLLGSHGLALTWNEDSAGPACAGKACDEYSTR